MSPLAHPISCPHSLDQLHVCFLAMLPRIERHADIFFRGVRCPDQRANYIAETVALSWQWYVRLAERGKDATTFASVLVSLAARNVKRGRRLCGQERAREVLSPVAQRRHGFHVEPLPVVTGRSHDSLLGTVPGQRPADDYEERLRDNTLTPVPDQVAFRIDWPHFLRTLTPRDRRLVAFLALEHTTTVAAARFQLSPGRVSQLRRRWCHEWYARHGERAPGEQQEAMAQAPGARVV